MRINLIGSKKAKFRCIIVFLALASTFMTSKVEAVTAIWNGGGITNNWSEPANWNTNATPTSSDSVVFDNTSVKNCSLDVVDTIRSISVTNTYTGTLDFGESKMLLTGHASFSSGGTIIASTGKLVFIGATIQDFTPQAGVIMPGIGHEGAGILRLQSNSLRALSFAQGSGSFDFNGQNIDSIVNDFMIVNGNGSSFYSSTLSGRTIKVRGNMSIFGTPPSNYVNMNPGANYTLAVEGTLYADVCNIGNSIASIAPGNASRSTNGGSNTGWSFGTTKNWSGTGNWSNASNWGGILPSPADSVVFTSGGTCSLDVNVSVRAIVFNSSYTGAFKAGNKVLTVKDMADFRSTGTFTIDKDFLLEFISFSNGQLIPKTGMLIPKIVKKGSGTIQKNMYPLKADTLILLDGEFKFSSGTGDTIFDKLDIQGGKLDLMTANLRIAAPEVNFATPAMVLAENATIEFIDSEIQTFTPKPNMRFQSLRISKSGGSVTVQGNGFRTNSLYLTSGTLNLGSGLVDSVETVINASGGTTLDFGSSIMKVGASTMDLSGMLSVIAGTGILEFTGNGAQSFIPKSEMVSPRIGMKGTGTLSISSNHIKSARLFVQSGTVSFDSTFSIDTIEILSGASVNFGGIGPSSYKDTVQTILGSGELNLGYRKTVVSGNIDLSTFSNVFGMSEAGLIFETPSPVSFTPRNFHMMDYLEQKGPGTLTILSNNLNVGDFVLSGGTLDLGSGLSDSVKFSFSTSPGTDIIFNNSELVVGASTIDFGVLSAVVAGTGSKLTFNGNGNQLFVPKDGPLHPAILIDNPAASVTCSVNALNGRNIAILSGSFTFGGAGLTHKIDTISGSGTINFAGANLDVKGNAHFGAMVGLSGVDATDTLFFSANTGIQQFYPLSATTHPVIVHNGTGTLKLNATPLETYAFHNNAGYLDFGSLNINTLAGGDFTVTNGSPTTISNLSNVNLNIGGSAHFEGAPGNLLNLDPPSAWNISTTNGLTADYATIANNTATGVMGNPSANCINGSGNTGWDWDPPTVTVINPANGIRNSMPSYDGNASDDASGVDSVEVAIYFPESNVWWHDGTWAAGIYWHKAVGTTNWSVTNTPGLGTGTYTVIARSHDALGRISIPDTAIFLFDNTNPISSISTPMSFPQSMVPTFSGISSDVGSGVSQVQIEVFNSTDNLYWNGSIWDGNPVWLSATGTTAWNYSLPSLTNGKLYTLTSRAIDSAGNIGSASSSVSFPFDDISPTVTISSSSDSLINSTFSVTVTFSEAVSGFDIGDISVTNGTTNNFINISTDMVWTFDVTPTADGLLSVEINASTCTDFAGNPNIASLPFARTADISAPVSTITYPISGTAVNWVAFITGTASDPNGISLVETAILDSIGQYYDGISSWIATPVWFAASGTTSWSSGVLPSLTSGSTYLVKVRATDSSGNVEVTGSGSTFSYDVTNPVSSVTLPTDGSFFNSLGTISGIASDAFGVSLVQLMIQRNTDNYYWDGSSWVIDQTLLNTSGTMSWSFDASSVGFEDGLIYSIIPKATDSATNFAQGNAVYYSCDFSPPVSVISSPSHNSVLQSLSEISGTSSDGIGSGVSSVKLSIKRNNDNKFWNGSSWVDSLVKVTAAGTTSWTYNALPVWISGSYTLGITAGDNVSNSEAEHFVNFSLDNSGPISTITSPLSGGQWNGWPGIIGTAVDSVSGIKKVEVAIMRLSDNLWWNESIWNIDTSWLSASGTTSWSYPNSVDWSSGRFIVISRATDSVNIVGSYSTQNIFTVDTTRPATSITSPVNGSYVNNLSSISGTTSDLVYSAPHNVSVAIMRNIDGYYWNNVDWVATHTWIMTDNKINWTRNYSMPVLTDGNFTITARATDSSGNQEIPGAGVAVICDLTPPVSAFTYPSNGAILGSLTEISGTSDDISGSGVSDVKLSIRRNSDNWYWNGTIWVNSLEKVTATGTTNWSYSELPSWTNGSYTMQVFATDIASNIESGLTTTFIFDTDTPISAITYPLNASYHKSIDSITGIASDLASGVASVNIAIFNNATAQYWSGTEWSGSVTWMTALGTSTWSFTNLPPWSTAEFTLRVRAVDSAGNMETAGSSISFYIDNEAPHTTSITVEGGATLTNKPSHNMNLSAVGADSMRFQINSEGWTQWEQYSILKPSLLINSSGDGIKNITVQYKDKVGNTDQATTAIRFDATPPSQIPIFTTSQQDSGILVKWQPGKPVESDIRTIKIVRRIGAAPDNFKGSIEQPIIYSSMPGIDSTRYTYDPSLPFNTPIFFGIVLEDSAGNVSPWKVSSVSLAATNTAPRFTSAPATSATQDILYSTILTAMDDQNNTLTFLPVTIPAGMTLSPSGNMEWMPRNNNVGSHLVVVRVTDGFLHDTLSYMLTVTNVNDRPKFTTSTIRETAFQDQPWTFSLQASDADSADQIVFSLSKAPAGMAISGNTISWTPKNSDVGTHMISTRATDAGGLFDTLSFNLVVNNANDAPQAVFTSPIKVNYGAIKVSFSSNDIDRHIGLDSILSWQCVVKKATKDTILYQKSGISKDTTTVSVVFAPFYNDSLIVHLTVSDSLIGRTITTSTSVTSMSRHTLTSGEWHMTSLPSKSNTLPATLVDTTARVYKWITEESNYKQLMANDSLHRGRSVWIYTDSTISLSTPSNQQQLLFTSAACTLKLGAGWNMLSSPFAFAVRPNLSGSEKLFTYSNNDYVETVVLEPWRGCFYYSQNASTLVCNGIPDMADIPTQPIAKLYRATNDWRIRVVAKGEDGSIDAANWLGVAPNPYNCDAHKPPPSPFCGVSIAINNNGKMLAQSIQPPQGTNEWLLAVKSAKPQMTTLTFEGIADLSDNYFSFLCNGTEIIEITKTGKAELRITNQQVLRIVVTTDPSYAQNQVLTYELSQNTPNPFNPSTSINFSVPILFTANGTPIKSQQQVSLVIYDTKGRLISTLVNKYLIPGRKYTSIWNGTDNKGHTVSSGLYVYRINIGSNFSKSRYMILAR